MNTLRALWIDLTIAVKEAEPPTAILQHCDLTYWSELESLDEAVARYQADIDLVCFDFDYPDRAGLRLLRSTKISNPALPFVMLTVQHSEALAIWAFRSKVWDYIVKPVSTRDAERCLVGISRALDHRSAQTPRAPATQPDKIPDEVAFLPKSEEHMLAPAIHYIERNFRSTVRSDAVAAYCNLSPFRFSRLFKENFGLTFRDYLINYRLREAYRLLENPGVSVADIAFAVGFNDPSYFSRIFKQRLGVAPSSLVGHQHEAAAEACLDLPAIPA